MSDGRAQQAATPQASGAESSISPTRLRWIMILVTGSLFMEILDGTIIATALPSMARAFGTTAVALNVGVSGYLLALGVFIPASGWVVDRFGARRVFSIAIALFTLTSALCGFSSSFYMFVALRILQGIAGAMMVPVGRLVVMTYTPKEKLLAALTALVWPALIAPVLGPAIGGFITVHFGWRWIFYLNLPLGLTAFAAALLLIPNAGGVRSRRFDVPGFLLSGVGMFSLLSGLERLVAHPDGLTAIYVIAGGGLLYAAVRHFQRASAPLVDLRPFAIPTFAAALRGGTAARMAIGSAPFLLPLLFQVGFGYDAFHSGLIVLTVFVGNVGMKSMTTRILRRFGYRTVMIGNGLVCAATLAACALLRPDTPLLLTIPILLIGGMARSMQFGAITTLAYSEIPKSQMPDANGLFNTITQVSMGAGITLGALGVRAGHLVATHLGWHAAGAEYRLAFLLVGGVALLAVVEAIRLPADAADHFVGRGKKTGAV